MTTYAFTDGIEAIATERARQREIWPDGHDDDHTTNELAKAAAAYLLPKKLGHLWPFEPETFHPSPTERLRELQKAGAFVAAEIDRLIRLRNAINSTPARSDAP